MTGITKEGSMADKKPRVAIVIPTYNEAENIGKLIERLALGIFPKLPGFDLNILIVDGGSTDNTAGIVEKITTESSNVRLIREAKKDGIGSAYLKGFNYAINDLKADIVVEFDGDFQHPPEMIPIILEKISSGYDYVLGSRCIAGGSEPRGRNQFRVFLTHFGGLLARFILFFPGKKFRTVTDPTTGLRATRVKGCLDRLDLRKEHLYSKKFGYKVQLLSETLATGARYAEVSLEFGNRMSGESKFEKGTAWDIFSACVRTRLKSISR
jgi:dolichol-phosphate mannosyltransferase